jgi:hypothetical protein
MIRTQDNRGCFGKIGRGFRQEVLKAFPLSILLACIAEDIEIHHTSVLKCPSEGRQRVRMWS